MFPHLSGRDIKIKWAKIMKATKGPLYELRQQLEFKNEPKKNTNFTRSKDTQPKVVSLAYSRYPPTKPTYVPPFQGYENPMPSTST